MFLNTTHFFSKNSFLKSFCEKVVSIGDQKQLQSAKITTGNQNNRKSNIAWIEDKEIVTEITKVINQASTKSNWNFLLREFEPLQYTVYNKDDYYDWHIDSRSKPHDNGLIRKLSFSICLNNDFEGGEFELGFPHPNSEKNAIVKMTMSRGDILVFPSHTWHKVNKVISGVRKSLVGWVVGKPFV